MEDGKKVWKTKTPVLNRREKHVEVAGDGACALIPLVVVQPVTVHVPLPIDGVPVDVDREAVASRNVTKIIYITTP